MIKVAKHIFSDLLRNRFIIVYTIILAISTFSLYSLDSDPAKATLSLLNIILLVVPLVSITFTTIYFFNAYEFVELLLAQPIHRTSVFFSQYLAISSALALAYLLGVGVPLALTAASADGLLLIVAGMLLTWVFVSLALIASLSTRDKARGVGVAMLTWFYFAVLYDGFILYIIYTFSDYPLEKLTLGLTALNPIDMARILILLRLDISALMGYTGAFYQEFFGALGGMVFVTAMLFAWLLIPLFIAWRRFRQKDI